MLKADAATCHIRIIAISGDYSEELGQRVRDVGAEGLLLKPVHMPTLLEAIRGSFWLENATAES